MGFISSGETVTLTGYLTQTGREYLLNNKSGFIITQFSLGDSDSNYFIDNSLVSGFVPDVSGDNFDCIRAISKNINIKYQITK